MGQRGRPKGTDGAFQTAYEFVKANPYTRVVEVVRATQVSDRVVRLARAKLREEGFLRKWEPPTKAQVSRDKLHTPQDHPPVPDHAMTPEELHQLLSVKLRGSLKTDEVRALSSELIKLMPKPDVEEAQLGPGPPLTEEEQIERVGFILRAVGPELTERAIQWARSNTIAASTSTAEGTQSGSPSQVASDNPVRSSGTTESLSRNTPVGTGAPVG